jgi:DNA-directed RNA polymerase subunit F
MYTKLITALTAFALLCFSATGAAAQETGTWSLSQWDKNKEMVYINFNRATEEKHRWTIGKSYARDAFPELASVNFDAPGRQNIIFTMNRDAGELVADGTLLNGGGSGVFTFTPNDSYFTQLSRLGFDDFKEKQQWVFAVNDVSLAYARGMKERNIRGLNSDKLLGYRAVGGDLAFVDELRSADAMPDGADQLIAFRVHDVDAEFISSIRATGLNPDNDKLIAMQIHDVTPAFIAEMRKAKLGADIDDYIAFRIHDVTPAFAKAISDMGFNASGNKLTALRIHDISPDYIREVRKEFGDVKLDQIIAARIHDVTPDFMNDIRELGLEPTLQQFIAMSIHDVTPRYISDLRSKGIETTEIDKLISLKIHGID